MTKSTHPMNPFPGLRPFRSDEDYLFFGREEQTLELLKRLAGNRFVAVVGTSGSGKSSLVRCGLLSELQGGKMRQAGAAWEIAVTHPGGNPLGLLTEALLEADLYDRREENSRENLLATLSRSHFGLVEAIKQAGLGEDTNFLLVVDQFEEIFRFHEAGQEQQEAANEFVSLLLEAVSQTATPIYVVLTMRSDFIGECGQFEGLAEMVNRGEFLIPRLTREQYKRVIEGPIKVAGGKIAPRLLQRLLNDLGQQADQLPCLQHALMRTWTVWAERGDSEALDLDDYQMVGRMSEALSLHADEIFQSLASDRQRELCQGIFQALTVQESESRGIRRPQRLRNLCQILEVSADELRPIIDAYRQSGVTFLTPSAEVELTERTIIDISHESLMRVWTRLRHWVEEEAQAAGIYRRLSESAELYVQGKAGLYRDPELGIALAWREEKQPNQAWAERYHVGFSGTMQFLEASQQASLAEEQAQEAARQRELQQAQQLAEARQERLEQQQRAARRLRSMIGGLAIVAAIAGIACVAALVANARANRLAESAQQSAVEANRQRETAQTAEKATQAALTQVKDAKTRAEKNFQKATVAERAALAAEQRSREFRYATDIQLAATLMGDERANAGQVLARLANHDPAANEELQDKEDLRGFEWHYLKRLLQSRGTIISGIERPISDCALTADGELILLDDDAQVLYRDAASGAESRPPRDLKQGRSVAAKALSPDGRRVAIAIARDVYVFDAASGEELFRLPDAAAARGLIFSPDGRWLVTLDQQIVWWEEATSVDVGPERRTGKPIASVEARLSGAGPVSISQDGLTVAVGQQLNRTGFSTFRLNPETREVQILLDKRAANFGGTRTYAIGPDGQTLAVTQMFDGQIRLYDTDSGAILSRNTTEHAASISAIGFHPSGNEMATAALDGAIKLWKDFRSLKGTEITLNGHTGEVTRVFYADDGKKLVSVSLDKSIRIWDLSRQSATLHQVVEGNQSLRGTFSPDGLLLATADGRNGIYIKDAATGKTVRTIGERTDGLNPDSIAFSSDNRTLALGFGGAANQSIVELWDLDRGERLAVMPGTTDLPSFTTDERSGIVSGLAFAPDGQHLVASFGSLFSLASGKRGHSPLAVYHVPSRRIIRWLEGHKAYTTAVAFSRDGAVLASGSYDGTAILWDARSWKPLFVLDNPDPSTDQGRQRVFDVAFSPDGKMLAMASYEGNVILWDVATGRHLRSLSGHANGVSAVGFSPDGRTLASGSFDKTIRLWSVATWQELVRLDPSEGIFVPRALAFSPNGQRLMSTGGSALLWSTEPESGHAEALAARLILLLDSAADFQSRIRMLSENLKLHAALELASQQRPAETRIEPALAAAQANYYASRQDWAKAVEAADRLRALRPDGPQGWLRPPGLMRLATAYLHQGRPAEGARLLSGGAKHRAADGLAPAIEQAGIGVKYELETGTVRVTELLAGYPGNRGNLRVGDVVLKVDDVELDAANTARFASLVAGQAGRTVRLTVRHADSAETEVIELTTAQFVNDPSTGELLHALRTELDERITKDPRNAGLLELRAELAGQWSGQFAQAADYTAAIEILGESSEESDKQELARLFRRRAEAYAGLHRWQDAAADYARVVTEATTDEELLAGQALARAGVLLEGNWTGLAPVEMTARSGATLTTQPDGSILASGTLADDEVYTLTLKWDGPAATGILLETIPHPSFKNGGAGREPVVGNFLLSEFSAVVLDGLDDEQPRQVTISGATADHALERPGESFVIGGVLDGNQDSHWSTYPRHREPHHAAFAFERPIENGMNRLLRVTLDCRHPQWKRHALGCFRLSVCTAKEPLKQAPSAATRASQFAAKVSDPWARLAAAYLAAGDLESLDELVQQRPQQAGAIGELLAQGTVAEKDPERAIAVFSQGLAEGANAELFKERARAYEALKSWDAAAADWASVAKDDPAGAKLLAEFANRLAEAGQHDLARAQRAQARQLLETTLQADPDNTSAAHALAQLLLDMTEPQWTNVKPAQMTAEHGATLTLQEDGSILASGLNLPGDVYSLSMPAELTVPPGRQSGMPSAVTAIELEVLPDPSLPNQGPGRHASGNFQLAEFRAFVGEQDDPAAGAAVPIRSVWASFGYVANDADVSGIIRDESSKVWHVWGRIGQSHRAIFFLEQPLSLRPTEQLTIVLKSRQGESRNNTYNLGRFRLALTNSPDAFQEQQSRLAAMKLTNLETRLAIAHGMIGEPERSAELAIKAVDQAESPADKAAVIEQLSPLPKVLAAVIKLRPGDTQFQRALGRHHAQRGQEALADQRPADALADLESARRLYDQVLTVPRPKWQMLQPTQVTSAGGATLTRLEDGSILASGINPDREIYTFIAPTELKRIRAIRLEALADPSLPQQGPGRIGNGNFHMNEFRVWSPAGQATLTDVIVSHDELQGERSAIDGQVDSQRGWSVYPRSGVNHAALFAADIDLAAGDELKFEMFFSLNDWTGHNLGRFRLSVSDDPSATAAEQLHADPIPHELIDLQVALGKAYAQTGQTAKAAEALSQALSLAEGRAGRAKILDQFRGLEQALAELVKSLPEDAELQLALARSFAERGEESFEQGQQDEALRALDQARQIYARLRAEYSALAAELRQDLTVGGLVELEASLAGADARQGRIDEAAAGLGRALDLAPDVPAVQKIVVGSGSDAQVLGKLAAERPADARLHSALARFYSGQGDAFRAQSSLSQARNIYEQRLKAEPASAQLAGELADLLLEVNPAQWTVFKIVDAKSAGGATLTALPDGSILASGTNPERDTYTIKVAANLPRIATLRLEAMADASLPHGGPGRFPDNGNFHLNEIRVQSIAAPVPLSDVAVTFATYDGFRGIVDGQLDASHWETYGRAGQTNSALLFADLADSQECELTIELVCSRAEWTGHNLGRFRLSASSEAQTIDHEQARLDALKIEAPWSRLGAAYHYVGDQAQSTAAFARAFDAAADDAAKIEAARFAAAFTDVNADFAGRASLPLLKLGQAKYLCAKLIADNKPAEVLAILKEAREIAPDDLELLAWQAEAHFKLHRWEQAIEDYAAVIERQTDPAKRREAQRAQAEAQLRSGRSAEGAETYSQEMIRYPTSESIRDALSAQLLAGNPSVAKGAASRLFAQVSTAPDAYWSQWLVRGATAVPGLATPQNQGRLRLAANRAGEEWMTLMTAAVQYRLGNLPGAEPLLAASADQPEFLCLAALLAHDRGEPDRARQFLAQAESWLRQQRAGDPTSHVPAAQDWRLWGVRLGLWREAVRKLADPRIAELDELLAKEPQNVAARLERSHLLAAAGLPEEALADLDKAGQPPANSIDYFALRGRILAALNRSQEALADLNKAVEASSDDALVYAARGSIFSQQGDVEAARRDLARSLELAPTEAAAGALADLLLAESEQKVAWSVIKPTQMKSDGGATLTLLEDGSVFVDGQRPILDVYTLEFADASQPVHAVRLEAIRDDRLPGGGPGTYFGGEFVLSGLTAQRLADSSPGGQVELPLRLAAATFEERRARLSLAGGEMGWSISGATGRTQTAYFAVEPGEADPVSGPLSVVLRFAHSPTGGEPATLGRFRLAVSDDPGAFRRERDRLATRQMVSGWARLAAAQRLAGNQAEFDAILRDHPEAAASIAQGYDQVEDWEQSLAFLDRTITAETTDVNLLARRAEVHGQLGRHEQARADWQRALELRPEDASLRDRWLSALASSEQWDEIAREYRREIDALPEGRMSYTPRGRLVRAIIRRGDPVIERLMALYPEDALLRIHLARDFVVRSDWQRAAEEYAKVIEDVPPSEEWYEYAATLLLAGKRAEHEQFMKRFVERAEGTDQPYLAYALCRTAGVTSQAVAAPEKLVSWGKLSLSGEKTAWYLHAAALAELRAGNHDEALRLFDESAATTWHPELNQIGLALFYAHQKEPAKAQSYLEQAETWLKSVEPRDGYYAVQDTDWLEFHLLLAEVKEILSAKPSTGKPDSPDGQ